MRDFFIHQLHGDFVCNPKHSRLEIFVSVYDSMFCCEFQNTLLKLYNFADHWIQWQVLPPDFF